jgi:hypothetical protein
MSTATCFHYVVPVLAFMMPKRPSTRSQTFVNTKRKHLTPSIKQKVDIVKKFDDGTPVNMLSDKFAVGISVLQDMFNKNKNYSTDKSDTSFSHRATL